MVTRNTEIVKVGDEVDEGKDQELSATETMVVDTFVGTVGPVIAKLGFGGMIGYCSGYALKIGARIAAATFGVGFICLQSLQYCGYIEINWAKVRKDLIGAVDSSNSGTVGVKDVRHYSLKVFKILRYKGPPAAGFGLGLYMGLMSD